MNDVRWAGVSWAASARSALEYRVSFLMQAAFMALNNFLFLAFWAVFFERFESVGGWELRDVALLYGVTATGFGVSIVLFGGCTDLARRIAAGGLDTWLLRPRSVFLQAATSRIRVAGFGDVASGLLLFVLCGGASEPRRVLAFVVASLVAATVLVGFCTLVQSLAFAFGHASTLADQALHSVLLLALYPPPLFGGWTRLVLLTVLPAALMGHLPTALVREWSWQGAAGLGAGVAALLCVTRVLWAVGLRRHESGNLTQAVSA